MFDCANVEMRELLPELVAGTLDATTRSRVEAHVETCAECASELETLRLVRAAFASAAAIDTRRIVAALPKPANAAAPLARPRVSQRRWMDWRVAAALTMMTVGGLSVVVSQRIPRSEGDTGTAAPRGAETTSVATAMVDTPGSATQGVDGSRTPSVATGEKAQLSFGGGMDDLDPASLEALMGALDEIDSAPVAPAAEPGRVTLSPIIGGDTQ